MKWNELDTENQATIRRLYGGEVLEASDIGRIPNFATQYSYHHHGWVITDEGKALIETGEWTRVLTDEERQQAELAALRQQLATARAALAWYALPDTYLITHPDKGSLIMHDGGHRARLALEKMDGGE